MGALPQALEIIFEVQMKRSNKKIARRKISFPTHKMRLFFLLFGPLSFSKLLTFSFLIQFKRFKVLWECHLQFYKSSLNSSSNKATYENFFDCSGIGFVMFTGLFF
jgi:hypothetical protein